MVSDGLESLAKRPIDELIADPLKTDHEWFRRELDRLVELAARISPALQSDPQYPKQLGRQLAELRESTLSHIESEEQVVFSLVESGQAALAQDVIRGLELEHLDLEQAVDRLRKLMLGFRSTEQATQEWAELYASLEVLEQRKRTHTRIESEILFPRVVYAEIESESADPDKE